MRCTRRKSLDELVTRTESRKGAAREMLCPIASEYWLTSEHKRIFRAHRASLNMKHSYLNRWIRSWAAPIALFCRKFSVLNRSTPLSPPKKDVKSSKILTQIYVYVYESVILMGLSNKKLLP